jgi:glycerophosphoryl diester phosphodiesterase
MAPSPAPERVAHRGMPRELRENTLPSFLLALESGADAIELDVHRTRDAHVVVHHDFSVQGRDIANSTWAELRGLDVGGGSTIPRLADVLDEIGDRATMYVELKGAGIEDTVVDICRKHGQRYALHSFDHDAIARTARLAPEIPRGLLIDRGTPDPIAYLSRSVERIRPRDVWPHWSLVDDALMRRAEALDVRVIVWTVNTLEEARRLMKLEVAGICTDDVRMLINL